jgi:hypothetical protein
MKYIAELIYKAIIKKTDPELIKQEVIEFRKNYQTVKYTFDIDISKLTEIQIQALI